MSIRVWITMKRLLALLLILTLLAGCVANVPTEPSQPTELPTDPPTEPPAPTLYAPGSPVEQKTNGAVRSYPLNAYCDGMVLMGSRVVLYYLGEQMTMKAYTGADLALDMVATYHIAIPANATDIQVTEQGIFYYDPGTNTVVVLNAQLREKHRAELPEGVQGNPVVNRAMDTVYYCTSEGIRSLDLNTGIAHLLRWQEDYSGVLMGACFDGDLLMCAVTQQDGTLATEFISTGTGLQMDKDPALRWVKTLGDQFFLMRYAAGEQYLFGQRDQEERFEYLAPEGDGITLAALELGGVLRITQQESGYVMDLYELESGLRKASVTLDGLERLRNVIADPRGYIWFLDDDTLYRWDVAESPISDDTMYTAPWYTEGDPNEAGLAQCQRDAETLGQRYGLEIRIWKDAVLTPWEKMVPDFRVEVFETALAELEAVFGLFPEDMLAKLGTICDSGKVSISIVADTGTEQGQQTWVDGSAYIAVEAGETLRTELLRTIYRVLDTYVLGQNSMLDEWDADKPVEDRIQYFLQALSPENESFFESWTNQSKLRTLCRAIRRAFDMGDYESALPWEQYLEEPLY